MQMPAACVPNNLMHHFQSWAVWYTIWLLIELTLKGVVFPFFHQFHRNSEESLVAALTDRVTALDKIPL